MISVKYWTTDQVHEKISQVRKEERKKVIDSLPGALEIQAHAKALNEGEFRDYMSEFLGKETKVKI